MTISTCPAASMPIMTRGARADAALLAALIETRECGMELVQLDRCGGERTTTHALVSAIGTSYRRDLVVLRAEPRRSRIERAVGEKSGPAAEVSPNDRAAS